MMVRRKVEVMAICYMFSENVLDDGAGGSLEAAPVYLHALIAGVKALEIQSIDAMPDTDAEPSNFLQWNLYRGSPPRGRSIANKCGALLW
jgi:hypothetical protein